MKTDKEKVKEMLEKLSKQKIHFESDKIIELENSCYGEDISFEFDDDGNLIDIYS